MPFAHSGPESPPTDSPVRVGSELCLFYTKRLVNALGMIITVTSVILITVFQPDLQEGWSRPFLGSDLYFLNPLYLLPQPRHADQHNHYCDGKKGGPISQQGHQRGALEVNRAIGG